MENYHMAMDFLFGILIIMQFCVDILELSYLKK